MDSPLIQASVAPAAADPTKPAWAHWHCPTDDLFWNEADPQCWFCGDVGVIASAPALTSQYGADFDDAAADLHRYRVTPIAS